MEKEENKAKVIQMEKYLINRNEIDEDYVYLTKSSWDKMCQAVAKRGENFQKQAQASQKYIGSLEKYNQILVKQNSDKVVSIVLLFILLIFEWFIKGG